MGEILSEPTSRRVEITREFALIREKSPWNDENFSPKSAENEVFRAHMTHQHINDCYKEILL
jgi:hypothetical protein